jgi:hypothetical protein
MTSTLKIYPADAPGREAIERYIHGIYLRTHRASIQSFMPILLAATDGLGRIQGAVGYRPASHGPFFLERYLDQPLEMAIACQLGGPVERRAIVEIGNLACPSANEAGRLMWSIARHLSRQSYQWVAFTGTRRVRELVRAFRAPLIELAPAVIRRAGQSGDEWGRYYSADPRVLAGFLPAAFDTAAVRQCEHAS